MTDNENRGECSSSSSSTSSPKLARPASPTLESMIAARLNRRQAMQGVLAVTGGVFAARVLQGRGTAAEARDHENRPPAGFAEIPHVYPSRPKDAAAGRTIGVEGGHRAQVLIRWGDPVQRGAAVFDVHRQSAAAQQGQFGYNNDFVAFLPLPRGSHNSDHGLLCVNHEYTNPELMFAGMSRRNKLDRISNDQLRIEMAAHGHSVIEIRRERKEGRFLWRVVRDSPHNRRITALATRMRISGPAAAHARMQTAADPAGMEVIGTVNNCAGGVTPWGTVLTAEENFHQYFYGDASGTSEHRNHARYGIGGQLGYAWHRLDPRFDINKTPHEPNRFGWVVEFDPYDRRSQPVKRTALGRCRHEGAAVSLSHDGRVVVYLGDDQRFEHLYKFVSKHPYRPEMAEHASNLLDEGTLYAARLHEDGTVRWLPLVYGSGPLTEENGFASQADVLIETRRAASLLGATPMDRPEDVEENPTSGRVYVMLTNNAQRNEHQVDAANPRPANKHGHIIELLVPKKNGKPVHTATEHRWDIFLVAGPPTAAGSRYQGHQPAGWISCPDNCTFDNRGRLWIATDGAEKAAGIADGVYACETVGPARALTRQFFHVPTGAEVCGPCFTPDNSTLFVAVQHPGEGSSRAHPSTRWPNEPGSDLPPQPAVVAITRSDGGGAVGG